MDRYLELYRVNTGPAFYFNVCGTEISKTMYHGNGAGCIIGLLKTGKIHHRESRYI